MSLSILEDGFLSVFKNFVDWWRFYLEIVNALGIDREMDEFATQIAFSYVGGVNPPIILLNSLIIGRETIVFGAGPNLVKHISILDSKHVIDEHVLVAADGATKALVEVGVVPHIIVTDLDGDLESIKYSHHHGSILAIHVHGDNIPVFIEFLNEVRRCLNNVIVTTQVKPAYPILNFGGFTDGDRAYLLTLFFKPSKIILAGMDFGNVVGRYSKPWLVRDEAASPRKRIKLNIAYKIVGYISCQTSVPTYTLSDIRPGCVRKAEL